MRKVCFLGGFQAFSWGCALVWLIRFGWTRSVSACFYKVFIRPSRIWRFGLLQRWCVYTRFWSTEFIKDAPSFCFYAVFTTGRKLLSLQRYSARHLPQRGLRAEAAASGELLPVITETCSRCICCGSSSLWFKVCSISGRLWPYLWNIQSIWGSCGSVGAGPPPLLCNCVSTGWMRQTVKLSRSWKGLFNCSPRPIYTSQNYFLYGSIFRNKSNWNKVQILLASRVSLLYKTSLERSDFEPCGLHMADSS